MFELGLLEAVLGGATAVLAWVLLAAIMVVLGCAAFTEFASASQTTRRIEALGRAVSSRFHQQW